MLNKRKPIQLDWLLRSKLKRCRTFSLFNNKCFLSSFHVRVCDTVKLLWNCLFVHFFLICRGASLVHQPRSWASISSSQFNSPALLFFIMFSTVGLPQQTKYLQSVFDYGFIQTQFGKSALQSWEGIPDGSFPCVRWRETPGVNRIQNNRATIHLRVFVCVRGIRKTHNISPRSTLNYHINSSSAGGQCRWSAPEQIPVLKTLLETYPGIKRPVVPLLMNREPKQLIMSTLNTENNTHHGLL